MMARLPLSLPWLLALLVAGWMLVDGRSRGPRHDTASSVATDVLCNMTVGTDRGRHADYRGVTYWFCSAYCEERFASAPEIWASERCLVCAADGIVRTVEANSPSSDLEGRVRHFCTLAHRDAFDADPDTFLVHLMLGIPRWSFQFGVAFLLLVSFGLFELLAHLDSRRRQEGRVSGLKRRFEITSIGWISRLLRWRGTRVIAQGVVSTIFVGVIVAALFGDQSPGHNIAPLLTWTVWWGGLVVAILFLGKGFCTVCPWDGLASGLNRMFGGRRGLGLRLPWPHALRNIWLATAFFVLLTWLDVALGITSLPRATAWLGIGMFGLSLVSLLLFERKAFCRYGCLVGRVSGLYSLFSAIELRARDDEVCASCKTMDCYRGNSQGEGCPTFEFPRTLSRNTYCTLCLECLRTCPHDNMAVNLRPFATDLVQDRRPRTDEAYLCLLMLSISSLHGLSMTPSWDALTTWLAGMTGLGPTSTLTLAMGLTLALPVLVYASLAGLSASLSGVHGTRRLFLEYSYSLLPVALFYHLAHNAEHLLIEGPRILAAVSDPLGRGWDLFGTATWRMPPLLSLEGLWGLQVFFVLVGHVYGLWIADKTTRRLVTGGWRTLRTQLPMLLAMIAFSVFSLWLLSQPMEMRLSSM